MRKKIVILGGGTGGTLLANRLNRTLSHDLADITVVDRDDHHLYQPGLLFVPFGLHRPQRLVRSRSAQLRSGIELRTTGIDHVDVDWGEVALGSGERLAYDVLVVATGSELLPDETPGLTGPGWLERVFTFYTLPGANALAGALNHFHSGHIVVNVVDLPIKCPVAPLEFCFLLDDFLRRHNRRADVDITYATPLDAAFTKPVAAAALGDLLAHKGVTLVTDFNTGEVDGAGGRLVSFDGREIAFDLGVVVPVHGGAPYVGRSPGLGDALDFIPTDPHTLQSKVAPEIFAMGDATDLAASKAGSVAHFEGETIAENIRRYLSDEPLVEGFDGHATCFVETGDHKALLIDFNENTEPVPGHYPGPIGLPLLRESRLNHLSKLAFEHLYWHALLPGRDLPGMTATMPTAGKELSASCLKENA